MRISKTIIPLAALFVSASQIFGMMEPKSAPGKFFEETASYDGWGAVEQEFIGENGACVYETPWGALNGGFRYRDLETGTFLSRDPLGFVDGTNLYAYVNQNPWSYYDPYGLTTKQQYRDAKAARVEELRSQIALAKLSGNHQKARQLARNLTHAKRSYDRSIKAIDQTARNMESMTRSQVGSINAEFLDDEDQNYVSFYRYNTALQFWPGANSAEHYVHGEYGAAATSFAVESALTLVGGKAIQYMGRAVPKGGGIKLPQITTDDGFLFRGFNIKTPIDIPVQRFGNMNLNRPDFWGLRLGTNTSTNRIFAAIKPEWNPLTQYTSGVIPKGTPIKFGIVGPQGFKYPGGSMQFIINSRGVANQSSKLINR